MCNLYVIRLSPISFANGLASLGSKQVDIVVVKDFLKCGKDRRREQGKRYLDPGSCYGCSENPGTKDILRRIHKNDPI